MQKLFTLALVFCTMALIGQNKRAAPAKTPVKKQELVQPNMPRSWESPDTNVVDSANLPPKEVEQKLPRKFMVYTKKPKQKTERTRLCFNLVSKDTVLNYCMNDSICKDPETYKILHESRMGDTTYLLILVDAFTKVNDDNPKCNSGKETKLVFFRWNTKTNKVKFKQKVVSSCVRNIVNMTKEPIANWDGASVLEVSYYKGGSDFPVVKFDPANPLLGLQDLSEAEPR